MSTEEARKLASRKQVLEWVERLCGLEVETRSGGKDQRPGKEHASILALMWAEVLFRDLAGWAIAHQAGLAVREIEGFPWPEGDAKAEKMADDIENEFAGWKLSDGNITKNLPADIKRKSIIYTLRRLKLFPFADELLEALKALDFGEVRPILDRSQNLSSRGFKLWTLRFRALEHVYFLCGMGEKKTDSLEAAADAYRCSIEAISAWDKRSVAEHFGDVFVLNRKQSCRRIGKRTFRIQSMIRPDADDQKFAKLHIKIYGREALKENGQNFFDVRKEAKEASDAR